MSRRAHPSSHMETALHYWKYTPVGESVVNQCRLIQVNLSFSSLRLIDGFRDLGSISIPAQTGSHTLRDIHRYLQTAAAITYIEEPEKKTGLSEFRLDTWREHAQPTPATNGLHSNRHHPRLRPMRPTALRPRPRVSLEMGETTQRLPAERILGA
ncbi:hypothetical protein PT974_12358 [Cladobotryum mycophilum]|uniref:Uncharacterized protein n=1 Tax=Cladobotryum mycophilum TaxID=491253 RepID=A0ABR0S7S2_9HYPO